MGLNCDVLLFIALWCLLACKVFAISFPKDLEGRFEFQEFLGGGWWGRAFKVFDKVRQEIVCVKVFVERQGDTSETPALIPSRKKASEASLKVLDDAEKECAQSKDLASRKDEDKTGFSRLAICLENLLDADPASLVLVYGGTKTGKDWIEEGRPSIDGSCQLNKCARLIYQQLLQGVKYLQSFSPPNFHNDLILDNFVVGKYGEQDFSVKFVDWGWFRSGQWTHKGPDSMRIVLDFCQLLCPDKGVRYQDADNYWKPKLLEANSHDSVTQLFLSKGPDGRPGCKVCLRREEVCADNAVSYEDIEIIYGAASKFPGRKSKRRLPWWGLLLIILFAVASGIGVRFCFWKYFKEYWNKRKQGSRDIESSGIGIELHESSSKRQDHYW